MKIDGSDYGNVWGWRLTLLDEEATPAVTLFLDVEDALEANPGWDCNGRYPNEPRRVFLSSKWGHIGQLDMVRVPYSDLY